MGFEFTRGYGLVDLCQGVQEATNDALPEMAQRAGERMHEVAVERTPRKSGRTRESFYVKPVTRTIHHGTPAYESGVASDYYVARFLEHGVGPHVIEGDPEAFTEGDKVIFARRVEHPGIRHPTHAVSNAAATVEAGFEVLAAPVLERWKRDSERRRR